jgi:serine/threonine-protein phosphatase 2B catalytic subunit
VNVELIRDHLRREGRLTIDAAMRLLAEIRDLLHDEPNVLRIESPVVVVGDLHGQYYDLLQILDSPDDTTSTTGAPPPRQWLFLGDYVDRGCFGTEICFLLFAMKLRRPQGVWLLRGNHECRLLTAHFNFKSEVLAKYNEDVYGAFMDVFDQLPVAATVTTPGLGTFLCIHGGLSPSFSRVDDLCSLFRYSEPPNDGPLCDVLWSDPLEEETAFGLDQAEMEEWFALRFADNPTRGCGYIFGWAAANDFCEANGLAAVIRGHEVQRAGCHLHRFLRTDEQRKLPLVITVFSAPNYVSLSSLL